MRVIPYNNFLACFKVTSLNPFRPTLLPGFVLLYGAGTMVAQVLILRELLVLAQGQELKLALGLWCWLLWIGVGSLAEGGRLTPTEAVCWRYWGCCSRPPS
jgi:hypothetical protein